VKDFGPYGGDGVSYPLSDRGLVLIRGKSNDGTGADSNGSGKVDTIISVSSINTCMMYIRCISSTLRQSNRF